MLDETDADLKAGLHYYQELGKRLIRIAVIRRGGCSEGALSFVIEMHQAIQDQWAYQEILRKLQSAYDAEKGPILPPFGPFVEYTLCQNSSDLGPCWREELEGFDAPHFPLTTTFRK